MPIIGTTSQLGQISGLAVDVDGAILQNVTLTAVEQNSQQPIKIYSTYQTSSLLNKTGSVVTDAGGLYSFYTEVDRNIKLYYKDVVGNVLFISYDNQAGDVSVPSNIPSPARGYFDILLGGSETARGQVICTAPAGNVVGDGSTLTVTVNRAHLLHTGSEVLISCPNCIAPGLNNGITTFNNTYAWGKITVTSPTSFTMPYTGMVGTSTLGFDVSLQKILSPNNKYTELLRRLKSTKQCYANLATGSNNTSHLRERIPLIVQMIRNGYASEVRGSLGIGNTLLWANSHGWDFATVKSQINKDVIYMVRSIAAAGGTTVCDLPPAQIDSDGPKTAGTKYVYELLRKLANDPKNNLRITDQFSLFVDPTTGIGKQRLYRGGDLSDNVHPSNEGVVMDSFHQKKTQQHYYPILEDKLVRSPFDSYRADITSLQFMDTLLAGDATVAASSLAAKCTGLVPPSVVAIRSTGNASRNFVHSYVQRGDKCGYDIIIEGTFVGNSDSYSIDIGNAVARSLPTLMLGKGGQRFYAGIEVACVPRTATIATVDTYVSVTASYPGMTNYQAMYAADSFNTTDNPDGNLSQPRVQGTCMPEFELTSGFTSISDFVFTINVRAAAAGTFYLRIGRPTLRQVEAI